MNKILDIALKDMSQSMRSWIGLIFMFGVPLMVAGIFALMFGGPADNEGFSVPVTRVIIANLDEGDPQFSAISATFEGQQGSTLGEIVATTLSSPELAFLVDARSAESALAARAAVDAQEAGVAVIIPPDFSTQFMQAGNATSVELYSDPTLTIGPGIVQSLIKQVMDSLSGGKIAANLAMEASGGNDPALIGAVMQQYTAAQAAAHQDRLIASRSTSPAVSSDPMINIVAWVFAGMTVFYCFYTGFATGQSILREEEGKTLPRLFTTPTPMASILAGKFLAVFLTVIVQIVVLLAAGAVIFQINWGQIVPLTLAVLGIVITASTFGIFFNSLLRSSKQSGAIFGGVITITGMLGMIPIFTMGVPGATLSKTVSLFVPQGWAVQALLGSMQNAPWGEMGLLLAGMAAWSIVFFAAGVWRFNHRYV